MSAIWTEENLALLKSRWEAGYSASIIASQIRGATRSAICGKAYRLGLSKRLDESRRQPAVRKRKGMTAEDSIPTMVVPDTSANVSLLDRRANQCCYPTEAGLYCGAVKKPKSSYCSYHHHRVWVPAIRKRRAA